MVIDLTGIATSAIALGIPLVSAVATSLITRKMGDKQAAATLCRAVENSLGVLQQQGTIAAELLAPRMTIPGVPDKLQPAVQYVMDHAGPEAERLGVAPDKIASKVLARIGLAQIATNQAVAASPAILVPDPLGPVATTLGATTGSRV